MFPQVILETIAFMEIRNGPTRHFAASSIGIYLKVKKEAKESSYVNHT